MIIFFFVAGIILGALLALVLFILSVRIEVKELTALTEEEE